MESEDRFNVVMIDSSLHKTNHWFVYSFLFACNIKKKKKGPIVRWFTI